MKRARRKLTVEEDSEEEGDDSPGSSQKKKPPFLSRLARVARALSPNSVKFQEADYAEQAADKVKEANTAGKCAAGTSARAYAVRFI